MQYLHTVEALILAAAIAAAARWAKALDRSGAVAAFTIGAVVFGCAGFSGALPLLTFFIASNLLGRWRRHRKEANGFEKGGERDWAQVVANGGVGALMLAAAALFRMHGDASGDALCRTGFAAAIAEANADTWATEIGSAIRGRPRLITTMAPVEPGRSGAVSAGGTFAAVAGAVLVAAASLPLVHSARAALVIAAAGTIGALIDSLLGATVQALYRAPDGTLSETPRDARPPAQGAAWVTNDIVNLLGTAAAASAAMIFELFSRHGGH